MTPDHHQRFVQRGIWIYLAIFFVLTALAWAPFVLHGGAKADFPLGSFSERFGDLVHFAGAPQKLANPNLENWSFLAGTLFPRNYGPLAVLVYLFLLKVCSPYSVVVFLSMVVCALLAGGLLLWRAARRSAGYRPFMALAIFATALLAWPSAQTELRGNIEGLLWIGYAVGLGCMFGRRWAASATALAMAMCIKPYPALWIVLLVFRRKYKQVALWCVVFVVTTVCCLAILGGGSPKQGAARIRGGSTMFFQGYIVGLRDVREAAGDHSLFETSKSITRVVKARGFHLREQDYGLQYTQRLGYALLGIYVPFAGVLLLWVLWKVRKMPFLNQVFSLSICLTLLPLIAADYTLSVLYIPMGLFLLFLLQEVATGRAFISQARLLCILLPCAWLMAPQPFLGIWAGDVRSLVLLFLLFVVLGTPMPMSIDAKKDVDSRGERYLVGEAFGGIREIRDRFCAG